MSTVAQEPAEVPTPGQRRCLIVERHDWETGAYQHQLQFPLAAARAFFGPDELDRDIAVRIYDPPDDIEPFFEGNMTVSHRYPHSSTRRTNRVQEVGLIPPSFVFFEETDEEGVYDVWWNTDKAIVAASFHPWDQAQSNQHRRGRLYTIVDAPVPRIIDQL